jgi:hypothetical protein
MLRSKLAHLGARGCRSSSGGAVSDGARRHRSVAAAGGQNSGEERDRLSNACLPKVDGALGVALEVRVCGGSEWSGGLQWRRRQAQGGGEGAHAREKPAATLLQVTFTALRSNARDGGRGDWTTCQGAGDTSDGRRKQDPRGRAQGATRHSHELPGASVRA